MPEEIDCQYTNEVVCPYCGYAHEDSWEFFLDGGDSAHGAGCCQCEREFDVERYAEVTYSASKMEERNGQR